MSGFVPLGRLVGCMVCPDGWVNGRDEFLMVACGEVVMRLSRCTLLPEEVMEYPGLLELDYWTTIIMLSDIQNAVQGTPRKVIRCACKNDPHDWLHAFPPLSLDPRYRLIVIRSCVPASSRRMAQKESVECV